MCGLMLLQVNYGTHAEKLTSSFSRRDLHERMHFNLLCRAPMANRWTTCTFLKPIGFIIKVQMPDVYANLRANPHLNQS